MARIRETQSDMEQGVEQRKRLVLDRPALVIAAPELPSGVPPFVPARGLANGHLQTFYGAFVPKRPVVVGTTQRKLRLDDDDFVVLHDDRPTAWERGDHVVLLLHGLAGSHRSGYMVRIASKLNERIVRTFRMDHRGCGAGAGLSRSPYHAGSTRDLAAAIRMVERLCPGSPISIAGFSISGNVLLRYLGEEPDEVPLSVFRAAAVCPPIDLHRCLSRLSGSRLGRRYDRYFTRQLLSMVVQSTLWRDDLPLAKADIQPERLYDFDELYTAPASGFESADHYYTEASARVVIPNIRVHTTILAAADDPLICPTPFIETPMPPNVRLCLTKHGGHLGFIGRSGVDPDRRWMDWRILDWLLN